MQFRYFLAGAAMAAALAGPARAGVTIITDTTDDIAYYGSSPTGWFGGSAQGDVIGDGFDTSQIVVTETNAGHGALTVDFQLYTQFSGTDCFGATCAYYGDLFLRTPSRGYSSAPFNYAVTLGSQEPNGGFATTGLYTVSSYYTSQDVWSSRGGFIYGGEYVPDDDSASPELAPTVLTGGNLQAGADVTQSLNGSDGYIENVSFTVTGADAIALGNGFDLLWGTGDCANDTVFGSVPAARVPEPRSLTLLAAGLLGLVVTRRGVARARG